MIGSRRHFLQTAVCGLTGALFPGAVVFGRSKTGKPNILWILAEDICPDFGCYGEKAVHTPVIDRLAHEGVRFTRAFTTSPVCSASRSAMMTGMYQTTIGAHNHRSQRTSGKYAGAQRFLHSYYLSPPVVPFTDYLKKAGYYTANLTAVTGGVEGSGKTDFDFALHGPAFDGHDWSLRAPGQPFFAQLSLHVTHRGKHWHDIEEQLESPVPPGDVRLPRYLPDHPVARQGWADYMNAIQVLDHQVGLVLQRLEDEGLAGNTVVIFTGDHGRCQVRGKQWLYDAGIHIPLIVRWPDGLQPAVKSGLVSAIDITATVLKIAGVSPPDYMQGRDFLLQPVRRDFVFAARDRCDETIEIIRAVRSERFKYIRNFMAFRPYMAANRYKDTSYPVRNLLRELDRQNRLDAVQEQYMAAEKPVEELYDVENDPDEVYNLAARDEYQGVLSILRSELYKWIYRSGDVGLIPEPILEEMGRVAGSKYAVSQSRSLRQLLTKIIQVIEWGEAGVERAENIASALEHPHPAVRWWAATGAGNWDGDAKVLAPQLETGLGDPDAAVRVACARAFCRMGNPAQGLDVLMTELENDNHAVRHYAVLAMEKVLDDIQDQLRDEMYDYVKRVRDRIFTGAAGY